MKQWRLNNFSELLDLLLASADIRVRDVWLVLDLHHRDGGIDLRWQWNMDLILIAVNSYTHSLLNVGRGDRIGQIDDKLCKLLHVDDVLGVVGVCVDDFSAAGDLQGLLILKRLLIGCKIPQGWRSQSGVAFFDASQLIDLLNSLLDVVLDRFDALVVLALTVSLQQLDITFIEI